MIVTSVPKRRKIDANSQPMIPPPSTTSRFGTSVCASSPVESTQRSESSPSIGGRSGNEPVAMTADLNVTSSPAFDGDRVRVLERPLALDPLDAVRLEQPGDAAGHLLDDAVLPFVGLREVEPGLPTLTPSLANVSSASLIENAVCTQALVGMQPTRRQVPPSSGSSSMHATFAPSCAARIAAV